MIYLKGRLPGSKKKKKNPLPGLRWPTNQRYQQTLEISLTYRLLQFTKSFVWVIQQQALSLTHSVILQSPFQERFAMTSLEARSPPLIRFVPPEIAGTQCVCSLSHVQLFTTLWTIAHQTPLSMGPPRQEYWSGLPCPPPGDLSNPGIETGSPALEAASFNS